MTRPRWFSLLTQHGTKPPYLLKYRSSELFIIGTVSLAVFTDMFLYAIIVPVIPFSLQSRSHVQPDRVQYWVSVLIAIYAAALLASSPICGWVADHTTSRRSPLLVGLFALMGSTALLNVGSSITVLIVGRILQGASASVVWVVGLALLADTVPQDRLAQAMGYVALGTSVGILIGPLLGGVVFDRAGYNAVFGMAYALVGLDIVLRLLLVEKKVAKRWICDVEETQRSSQNQETQDQGDPGAEARALRQRNGEMAAPPDPSAVADVEKSTAGSVTHQQPPESQDAVTAAAVEPAKKRLRNRLPPVLSLLYSRRLLAALFGSIIQAAMMTAFDSVLTIHVASTFHWTSTGAALLFLPLVIPTFLAPAFGWLADRVGGRYPAALGFLLAVPPLVCLRFVEHNSLNDKVLMCALLALVGLTLSMTFPPFMAEISRVVEDKERKMVARGEKGYGKGGAYAQAYGLFNVAFAGGCVVGPLLAGFVVQEEGWGTMAWVLGVLAAVTAVPTFLWMGGWVFEKGGLE